MTVLNSSTKITTSYVVQFNVRFESINEDFNTSSTARIIDPYGPSSPDSIIVGEPSITAIGTLSSRITSLGTKTVIPAESAPDSEQLYFIYRIITVREPPLSTDSKTPCLSQSIQGMRVISDIDVSNNKITYINNMDIQPLDIDLYPSNDRINNDGSHTTSPLINNITITGTLELKNVVTRKTVSYTMKAKEAFVNTPYTYNTINPSGGGIEIKKYTSTLQGSFSNTGYNFAGPAKSNTDYIFGSNITYYNDELVTRYTTKMSNLLNTTGEYLRPLMGIITLSNLVGTPQTNICASETVRNVCSNPTYMQRIMDAYNNGNSPIGIYNQERNTMTKIIQASTASNNECHLIFENKNEFYNDRTYYDSNNSNNYIVKNTLKYMSFPMVPVNTTTCDFNPIKIPVSNVIGPSTISIYPPIKASDLTLSYGNNLPTPYFTGVRSGICQINSNTNLSDNVIADYRTKANTPTTNPLRFTTINILNKKQIGYDKIDYLIEQQYTPPGQTTPSNTGRFVLRAKFDLARDTTSCVWSYTSNSFKLQIALPDTMSPADKAIYISQSFVDVIDTDSVSLGGSDNVSPLFLDAEYS